MKRPILLAGLCLALLLPVAAATHALADGGPVIRLPGIAITPHPAPDAPDYGTCLLKCAARDDVCRTHARDPIARRACRLQRSLCDSECIRYGINER